MKKYNYNKCLIFIKVYIIKIGENYMKKNIKKIISIILILIVVSIYTYSFADVGSFDRYDSGSSSWSSSSRNYGSSSSSWNNSYSSDGDLGFLIGLLFGSNGGRVILVILIILIIVYSKNNKGRVVPSGPEKKIEITDNITKDKSIQIANKVMAVDPLFSEEKFITFTKELFIKLQNAWTARNWEPMRLFETPELFEAHKAQVQGYIDTNRINVMDRIAVNFAYLYKYSVQGDKEILEVALKSTMKDYIIDERTKQVLEGNKTQDRKTLYKLTFERKKGILTENHNEIKTTNCPNCGAPTKITSAGKCEYCDSIILTNDHGWVLSNLEPFRN